jgi:hypothetical protein
MAWWKWALVFLAGMVVATALLFASDIAILTLRGEMDLRAEDVDGTELYDDTPIRELGDMTPQERQKFFPIWGRAYFGVSNFKLNDQQGRTVIKVKNLRGNFNLDKLRTGVYRGSVRVAEEIDLWLYRAPSGEVSLAEAFGTTPTPVKRNLGLEVPLGDWAMHVGPVKVGRTRLHIMMTDTPVVIELEDATVYARQRPGETAPKIFITEASARMVEPKPLPNPIPASHCESGWWCPPKSVAYSSRRTLQV